MEYLKVEQHGPVTHLIINRHDALNALNKQVLLELRSFLQKAELEGTCPALILSGSGDKAFIAGADIKEMSGMNNHEILQFCALGQEVTTLLERASFLTIAAVNGFALGGGFEIALACDYIYAAEEAHFGFPEVELGIIPGFGGTQRLPNAVGVRLAKELILTGRTITAQEAHQFGIVNKVCWREELHKEAVESAKKVASHSHTAITKGKRAINFCIANSIDRGLEHERELFVECFASQGRVDGFEHFLKKQHMKKSV